MPTSARPGLTGNSGAAAPLSISARNVWKSYNRFVALKDVSLEVGAGEFLTLLGPSGSGKTTFLNIIAGFARLDSGSLFFGEEDVTLRPLNQRGLGMVFQNYALFPHMTVAENVAFPLRVRRMGSADIGDRVQSVLRLVQLEGFEDRDVQTLSGGQRQRVALARAVVFNPRIVLMDEPLSALDKNLREQMQVEIRHLHKKIGATTIYVTHDQREALTLSDRIAVLNEGAILQCDSPSAIYNRPGTAFVAEFIGETTLLPVTRHENGVVLSDGSFLRASPPKAGGDWSLVLRSETVLMPEECGPQSSRFPIVVRDVFFQGDSVLMIGEAAGAKRLTIRRPLRTRTAGSLPVEGNILQVGVDPDSIILVPAGK
jgi:putative spermidine/putrescine transport system ATP-binding protein